MPSATDFLPSSMTEFMNLLSVMSPNLGSGRISRFSGRRRRDIASNPFSLQPGPEPVRGLLPQLVMPAKAGIPGPEGSALPAGIPAFAGMTLRGLTPARSLGPLGAVFGTGLAAVLDPLGVEHAAKDVVADARKVAHAAAADQHHAMLLEVVALAGDVADHLALVGEADLGHLPQRRVRLLRGRRIDAGADTALLRILLHRRDLGLGLLRLATLADQLVDRRHEAFTSFKLLC